MAEHIGLIEVKCVDDVGVAGDRIEPFKTGDHPAARAGRDQRQRGRSAACGTQQFRLNNHPIGGDATLRGFVDRFECDARRVK